MDIRILNDSVIVICGPSGCGKTVFAEKLLANRHCMLRGLPCGNRKHKIHWYYGEVPPSIKIDALGGVNLQLHKGLHSGWSDEIEPYDIVVIDDLFLESQSNKEVTNAFTRLAHHRPCTFIFITQNLFQKGKDSRTRNLNCHYLILFRNPRDATAISQISRQMFPGNSKCLNQAFTRATDSRPYSYIFLDFRQETPNNLRVRSEIFPNEDNIIYVINNST